MGVDLAGLQVPGVAKGGKQTLFSASVKDHPRRLGTSPQQEVKPNVVGLAQFNGVLVMRVRRLIDPLFEYPRRESEAEPAR